MDNLSQGSQTQMGLGLHKANLKLTGRISAMSRVGGPQESTEKSCVYFK
jgi:hypothetical protein